MERVFKEFAEFIKKSERTTCIECKKEYIGNYGKNFYLHRMQGRDKDAKRRRREKEGIY